MTTPTLTGPIEGSLPPWGAPSADKTPSGYTVEEYRMTGTVAAYRAVGEPGQAGRWEVETIGDGDYHTRILVMRPSDADAFSGTVFLHWNNVSAGFEGPAPRRGEIFDAGHAFVGVSAQEVGLYGMPGGFGLRGRVPGLPLIDHDPERYGELFHPGEPGAYGIFSHAAMAVGPQRAGAVDPMGGLGVERVIAQGASQSAMKLVSYLNGVHPLHRVIDGAMLTVWEGRGPRLDEGPVSYGGWRTRVRDDLDIPVMVVNSEFETHPCAAVDVRDHDRFRFWEVTGAPHAVNTNGPTKPDRSGRITNRLSFVPVYERAVRHLVGWVGDGVVPPSQPRIVMEPGTPPHIMRDSLGNGVGGIRLPEIVAPVAEYRGAGFGTGAMPLFGGARAFSDEQLGALYASSEEYLELWNSGVDQLLDAEAIRPEDAAAMRERGKDVELPFGTP